jgi:small-conductance mechanosensitive channel/CRP-like cAMP-binding protein
LREQSTILRRLSAPFVFAGLLGAAYALEETVLGGRAGWLAPWLLAAFLTALGVVGVQLVRTALLDVFFRRARGREAPALLHWILSIVLYFIVGLVVASIAFNYTLTGAIATSAVASVVVGLALQETLGNFFAGVSLQVEQPFRPGDYVRIAGIEGRVAAFTWRSTTVDTVDDTRIVIPNGNVAGEPIEVFARDQLNRRRLVVSGPYEVAPQRVIRLLKEAVESVPGVSDRITPQARIGSYDASSIGYEVLYWVEDAMRMAAIDAQIRERAWYVFARHGVWFPYPHQVDLAYEPPTRAEPIPDVRELRLSEVALLEPLTPGERRLLAERSRTLVFAPGERMLAAGGAGGTMYVVLEGHVEVTVPREGKPPVHIARLGPGEVVGEISLLTGEPRSADVHALDEVEVLEVGKAAMAEVLAANEALFGKLTDQAGRRAGERSEAVARDAAATSARESPASLLQRMKRFFGS